MTKLCKRQKRLLKRLERGSSLDGLVKFPTSVGNLVSLYRNTKDIKVRNYILLLFEAIYKDPWLLKDIKKLKDLSKN